MAPSSAAVGLQLRQLVYYHLDNLSHDNALFFAERLVAHDPKSSESAYLLALSHLRSGDPRSAYETSKASNMRGIHIGCAYVFAQACLLMERYKDGIVILEKAKNMWLRQNSFGKHSATNRGSGPDTACVWRLLGMLYRAYDDRKRAIYCFEECLKANPFMWDVFTALCDMGVNLKTTSIFRLNEVLLSGFVSEVDSSNGLLPGQREGGSAHPTEPLHKKSSSRTINPDSLDPFEGQKPGNGGAALIESAKSDFMLRIQAARAATMANQAPDASEHVDIPGMASMDSAHASRIGFPSDAAYGLGRRTRNTQPTDPSLGDAPPKMSHKLGSKRSTRLQERVHDDPMTDAQAAAITRTGVSTAPGLERKRTVSGQPIPARPPSEEPGAPPRRSTRINMFRSTNSKANTTMGSVAAAGAPTRELKKARPPISSRIIRPNSASETSVGRAVSGNRKPMEDSGMDVDHAEAPRPKGPLQQAQPPPPPAMKTAELDPKIEEILRYLLDLLRKLGAGYYALSQFRCMEALSAFASLPRTHQDTPWLQSQIGRAHYEQAAYADADKHYRRLRQLAPYRVVDMEVYSTILWHLKKETDLSFLAHELVDLNWYSAEAWCALGNAWSLARDHEQAIRCFKRATQLDAKFAYAFTLQGHEYVTNEEYEKALTAYRQALSADRRHYNAYYGIGRVYEKLGQIDRAHAHFHAASVINPTNSVLICCLGTMLERQRQPVQALKFFDRATELAPHNALTRYKKARALLALDQLDAAQEELETLKSLAPDEATVHFLLGKLYKCMNDKASAVRSFTIALNLDPKASQQIKEAIESLEDDEPYEDSIMTSG